MKNEGRIENILNSIDISSILEKNKFKQGLKRYLAIQRSVFVTNVAEDTLFQEMFSNFYKLDPFKDKDWKDRFFTLFEEYKYKNISFEKILARLYERTGKIEGSFSSKLIATLDSKEPVIDSVILTNLGYKKAYRQLLKEGNIKDLVDLHKQLEKDFDEFLSTALGEAIIATFKGKYPYANINEMKILDLILWQIRK